MAKKKKQATALVPASTENTSASPLLKERLTLKQLRGDLFEFYFFTASSHTAWFLMMLLQYTLPSNETKEDASEKHSYLITYIIMQMIYIFVYLGFAKAQSALQVKMADPVFYDPSLTPEALTQERKRREDGIDSLLWIRACYILRFAVHVAEIFYSGLGAAGISFALSSLFGGIATMCTDRLLPPPGKRFISEKDARELRTLLEKNLDLTITDLLISSEGTSLQKKLMALQDRKTHFFAMPIPRRFILNIKSALPVKKITYSLLEKFFREIGLPIIIGNEEQIVVEVTQLIDQKKIEHAKANLEAIKHNIEHVDLQLQRLNQLKSSVVVKETAPGEFRFDIKVTLDNYSEKEIESLEQCLKAGHKDPDKIYRFRNVLTIENAPDCTIDKKQIDKLPLRRKLNPTVQAESLPSSSPAIPSPTFIEPVQQPTIRPLVRTRPASRFLQRNWLVTNTPEPDDNLSQENPTVTITFEGEAPQLFPEKHLNNLIGVGNQTHEKTLVLFDKEKLTSLKARDYEAYRKSRRLTLEARTTRDTDGLKPLDGTKNKGEQWEVSIRSDQHFYGIKRKARIDYQDGRETIEAADVIHMNKVGRHL